MYDCSKIIAVDISENKLKLATEFGATHTVNAGESNPVQQSGTLQVGTEPIIIRSAGRIETIEQAFDG